MRVSRLLSLLLVPACGTCAAGLFVAAAPSGAPGAQAPTTAPAMDPWLQDLQKRVNSTDSSEREAAQKQMASIATIWQQPELLEKLSDATTDPELKNLFHQRAELVRARGAEKDAMNLPPISLSLHNAGFPELADALNTAMDTDIFKANINNGGPGGFFNLDAKSQPFWEVFRALQEQQPFMLQNNGNGLSFYSNALGIHNFAVSGPAMVYPQSVSYRRMVNLQTTEPPTTSFNVALTLMVDPRVPVARFTSFSVVKAVDEAGHSLLRGGQSSSNGYPQSNTTTMGFTLQPVDNMGKALAMSCDARIAIQTSFVEGTLSDLQNNLNKEIALGNRSIRITGFGVQPNMVSVQTSVNQMRPPMPGEEANAVIQYRVTDANGKSVWTYSGTGGFATNAQIPAGSIAPYKLVARTASKTQELNLHFELKDIPLP